MSTGGGLSDHTVFLYVSVPSVAGMKKRDLDMRMFGSEKMYKSYRSISTH